MDLVKIRRALHKIPERGFQEFKTQQYLLDQIESVRNERMIITKWRTGLLVKVLGTNKTKTIAYRADIDGLPITEQTGLDFKSMDESMMHACGHDFHMTIALGALNKLIKHPIKNDVVFIFQPAEEGPGGAKPLLASAELKALEVDEVFSLHVAPELPVGTVSTKPGLLFANTSELFIDFKGKGGHAAYPHLTHDMAVAASTFLVSIQQIVSRRTNPIEGAVLTIGKMTAGTVQNIIAETARLEGTIRTTEPTTIETIKSEIEIFSRGFELSHHCKISIDYGSNYYGVYNDARYVQLFKDTVKSTNNRFIEAKEAMTGEDFGYFLKDIPGFMFWLGVNSDYGLHHAKLNPDESALQVGADLVYQTMLDLDNANIE
ncbi:N-acetyldiaminopimelate deacetylase [Halolactibacillus alkaliphilus]|uniref:N-acetyldiaminopimelate deacetylase n=1 Tax=Halolactibacillus alkaliphilus TaxID=442899 RepID=A0A511X3J0_9BACI|nr:N-acetyldiaminopimelate deacetylase [Halolactibacillus alkaliphilus]GEN57519.1 N-acetyldiaminopimelate deacetylase [Halolactibacillus alkaliphilus]GGN73663.1 N-acetyldiaminopimelate deacetylase [Halolactibacillus alkaliphilus]SFO97979.1 N-acetyldiaminopimelate deacetylase [Halolactibacillus alkaliphilus]